MFEIDHIDPKWKEGRDYQLVCGLNCSLNLIERDATVNASKSNRFLPWRVSPSDLGSIPVHPGDLCQFLDPDTGEWTLEEFMGEWWYSKTRSLCGQHVSGVAMQGNLITDPVIQSIRGYRSKTLRKGIHGRTPEQMSRDSIRANQIQKERKTGRYDPEFQRRIALLPKSEEAQEKIREGGRSNKGKVFWNNGVECTRAVECPGEGWEKGQLHKWWTNGKEETKSIECPGKGWDRGRLPKGKTSQLD